MGLWDTLTGRTQAEARQPRRAVLAAVARRSRCRRPPASPRPASGRSATAPPRARRSRRPRTTSWSCSTTTTTRTSSAAPTTFGFTWLLARQDPDDLSALVTDLHAVNTSLEAQGFGAEPALLAGRRSPTPAGRTLGLVYLYKQGTFYPFAPPGRSARQPAGDPDPRPAHGRPAGRAGPQPLDAALGRPRPLTPLRPVSPRPRPAPAGRASAAARPWPSARSRGRPRSG